MGGAEASVTAPLKSANVNSDPTAKGESPRPLRYRASATESKPKPKARTLRARTIIANVRLANLEFRGQRGSHAKHADVSGRIGFRAWLAGLLDQHGSDAKILAGVTDLMVRMRSGRMLPRVVIDLKRVSSLRSDIVESDSCLRIGARTMYKTMRAFGFGEPTQVDLPGENPGILPRLDDWSATSLPTMSRWPCGRSRSSVFAAASSTSMPLRASRRPTNRMRVAPSGKGAGGIDVGGHVAPAAVGVGGVDGGLLLHAGQRDDRPLGQHVEGGDARAVLVELHALGDPVIDRFVVVAADFETQSAAVWHLLSRLGEHQTARRIGTIEAAAGEIVEQGFVVELRVVAA